MELVSPADEDFEVCSNYGRYFKSIGKSFINANAGARWELALARPMGCYREVREHLERVGNEKPADYECDHTILKQPFDFKAVHSPRSGRVRKGLLITQGRLHQGTIYALGDCTVEFPFEGHRPKTLTFEFAGWEYGDAGLFIPCPHIDGKPLQRERHLLRSPAEFFAIVEKLKR